MLVTTGMTMETLIEHSVSSHSRFLNSKMYFSGETMVCFNLVLLNVLPTIGRGMFTEHYVTRADPSDPSLYRNDSH